MAWIITISKDYSSITVRPEKSCTCSSWVWRAHSYSGPGTLLARLTAPSGGPQTWPDAGWRHIHLEEKKAKISSTVTSRRSWDSPNTHPRLTCFSARLLTLSQRIRSELNYAFILTHLLRKQVHILFVSSLWGIVQLYKGQSLKMNMD